MKKLLLSLLLTCSAALCVRADLIWYEGFDYPDGQIFVTSTNLDGTTNWFRHSGSANDSFVRNRRLEISASGGSLNRTDDVHRPFATIPDSPYTNSQIVTYASFTVNCTNLPNATGSYFAHFKDTTTSNFVGRVFALVGTAGVGTPPTNLTTLPNTWRLGISGAAGVVNQVFPVDLATNTDYQVVLRYDPVNAFATLWVNPTSSSDASVSTSDAITSPWLLGIIQTAFAFRQGGSFGNFFCTISNLAVATTFEEAATAVWNAAPVPPAIVYQPQSSTNFSGSPALISAVAAGQGQRSLTYQWLKNGAFYSNPDGNTNALAFPSAAPADSGQYQLIATTAQGLSATSAVASLWVTNPPVPPTITLQPTNRTVYFGQTATFNVNATGPGTITYQWNKDGTPLPGETGRTLTIANVRTNNNTTGTYSCGVTNEFGGVLSSNAVLSAMPAPAVTIGYLRTLVDPVFFLPTNTTALYTVTGIVTTHTNITSAANSSLYMQDETGGINVFFGGSTARPAAGDSVTVTGPLGQFNSLLELNLTSNDPAHSIVTNSSGNLLPPGQVLPFSFTNGAAFGGVGESIRKFQGLVVTLTNVYFVNAGGTFGSGANYVMTNQAGERFSFRVDSRVFDIIGKPIPQFAWTVTGPMAFFLNATAPNRSAGYQILPTRYADIVTLPPPAVTGTGSLIAGQPKFDWLAQPYISYSILAAADVAGPFLPLITGLTFNTTAGQFTDTNASSATRFYQIVSP